MTLTAAPTTKRVALVGSPNAGKTSLFNHLTGLRAKTGNYPGVTIARRTGTMEVGDQHFTIEDLPGTYSLTPVSPDEQVVTSVLEGTLDGSRPDALIMVLDATTLRRSLVLAAHVLNTGLPVAIALSMADDLANRGGSIDVDALSQALGVPVRLVQTNKPGCAKVISELLRDLDTWPAPVIPPPTALTELSTWTTSVLSAAAYRSPQPSHQTSRIDSVLLHPLWGLLVFFAVMFAFFQVIFTVAAPMADGLEGGIKALSDWVGPMIGLPLLEKFVTEALFAGVGAVVVFIPQIALLFLMLAILEGTGYLARAAFLMDRVMAVAGLDGRAFVSMLSSVACAIPGIMSTRTIANERDRMATIMASPLMTCSARLPVYVLLVSLMVPSEAGWGPFGAQGTAMFALYFLGGVAAMVIAGIMKRTLFRSGPTPFVLEMPPYRLPSWRSVALSTWEAVWAFLRRAGTVILVVTIALWGLMAFPGRDAETNGMPEAEASAYVLDHSYAATIGKAIEPVTAPLGFDWRINIGLVGAMGAREVFVSTMGAVVAAEDPENPSDALADLTYTHGPREGEKVFTAPTMVALLVWFVFALQCVSTLAAMRRETGTWKWPAIAFAYMGVLAYGCAWLGRIITQAVM